MRVALLRAAEHDLVEIQRYIALDSMRQSRRVVTQLREAATKLGDWPLRSPVVRVRGSHEIRRSVWSSYSIFYVVDPQMVFIVRILHSSRDFDRELSV